MADSCNKSSKYNVEAAEILANEALVMPVFLFVWLASLLLLFAINSLLLLGFQHLPITEAAPIYEQLLAVYPTAVSSLFLYVRGTIVTHIILCVL